MTEANHNSLAEIKAAIYDRIELLGKTQAEIAALKNELANAQRKAMIEQSPAAKARRQKEGKL